MTNEKNPGTTVPLSAEHFDAHAASIPDEIRGDDLPEPEILPPGTPDPVHPPLDEGWPEWDVQQILSLPFFYLGRRYGEQWELDEKEKEVLARAWKPILDRYLPIKETALGTALLVTVAVIGPRVLMTDWDKKPGTKKADQAPAPASTKTAAPSASSATSGNGVAGKPVGWVNFVDE